MRRFLRLAMAVVITAALYAAWFLVDARPDRDTPWPVYLGLALAAGLVALGGEFVAGSISERDSVTDPLPRRVGRLLLLLTSAALFAWVLFEILSSM